MAGYLKRYGTYLNKGYGFKRRKISRRRRSYVRRRRYNFARRKYGRRRRPKLSRFGRIRKRAQLKATTVVTMGKPVSITKKATEDFTQFCLYMNLLDFHDNTNKDLLNAYAVIYDQFKIKKCVWKFRMTTTQQFVDEGNDKITTFTHAYDPDCATRNLVTPQTIYKIDGYKKVDMKPYNSYNVTLYPKFIDALYSGASGSNTHMSSVRMRTPWMDMAEIRTPNISSYNGHHVTFEGLNNGNTAKTECDITSQVFVHWQFRGKRNGQLYK